MPVKVFAEALDDVVWDVVSASVFEAEAVVEVEAPICQRLESMKEILSLLLLLVFSFFFFSLIVVFEMNFCGIYRGDFKREGKKKSFACT